MGMETAFSILAAILILDCLRIHFMLVGNGSSVKRPGSLAEYPAVSVIRPIRGLDSGLDQNILSALNHGYAGDVQTILVFDDANEPALPYARQLIDSLSPSQRESVSIVYSGPPSSCRTGKLNAMIAGMRHAKHEVIVFADSDIRPEPGALTALVDALFASPNVGASFAPVVVVSEMETLGDAGYALMLNGLYGSAAKRMAEVTQNDMPFIMGQFMALRRETILEIGGLERLEGQFVDDMYLGFLVKKLGKANAVSSASVPVVQFGLSFWDFLKTFRRWIAFSRSGLPSSFGSAKMISIQRGVDFWIGLLAGVVAVAVGSPVLAVLYFFAPLFTSWSIGELHRRHGGAPLSLAHRFMAFFISLFAPVIFLSNNLNHSVEWRGRVYHLNGQAILATQPADVHEPRRRKITTILKRRGEP